MRPAVRDRLCRACIIPAPEDPMPDTGTTLEAIAAARWRIAITLTVAMMAVYFGFLLLIAFNKPLLGTIVADGLSLGILLGASVIVVAWALTWIYVRWANAHYDSIIRKLKG
jgi:uncharacterized membrane protein (DUF485 family)